MMPSSSHTAPTDRTPEYPVHLDLMIGTDDAAHPSVPVLTGSWIPATLALGRDGSLVLDANGEPEPLILTSESPIAALHAWLWKRFTLSPWQQARDADTPPAWLRRVHTTWTVDDWRQANEWMTEAAFELGNAIEWEDDAGHSWVPVDADWLDEAIARFPELVHSLPYHDRSPRDRPLAGVLADLRSHILRYRQLRPDDAA